MLVLVVDRMSLSVLTLSFSIITPELKDIFDEITIPDNGILVYPNLEELHSIVQATTYHNSNVIAARKTILT